MGSYLSAGVYIEERDLSNNVVAGATNVGAYVGRSTWGPPMTRTLVTSEKDFADLFGEPTDETYEHFFTAAGFLKFGQSLYFVRAVAEEGESRALNAGIGITYTTTETVTGDYIKDWESYSPTFSVSADEKVQFFAKYPGELGNNIQISIMNRTAYMALDTNPLDPIYATVSGDMPYIEYGPADTTEFVVLVQLVNPDDATTELVEQWLVSDIPGTKDNFGNSMYIENKINSGSKYILAFNNINRASEIAYIPFTSLANGSDGSITVDGDIQTGYDLFSNPEEISINYLIGGANNSGPQAIYISNIAETRADCFSLHDVQSTDVVGVADISTQVYNVNSYRTVDISALNTSYSALYANWFYIYDKYNDKNRWVPCSGYVAGIYANTANVADSWFAPAGLNRGVLRGVIKTAMNPNKAYRDQMYQKQVNPIVNFPGQGIVVWGQKTLQTKPSSFDRVNVRLLFLYIEKSISDSAKYLVFEQNDNLLRAVFLNMVNPFLTDIKGRRGIYDFLVDVGDKVNTPEVIDQNQFRAEIYIKPTKVAESVILRFNATKTGVDFTEIA